ncbi:MAG TPA: UpxY family transcription antiterminator [Saprospiraceae bacterium]|nr:UpxY family transcription antiterminator [Saprospiraceae bacterium]
MNPKVKLENHLHEHEARWFAVHTRYKREKIVHQRLTGKGIESYLPLQQFVRRYSRKVRTVELPLISRYIFTRIVRREYVPVLETQDVAGFVRFSNNLISIPNKEIDLLQRIVGEGIETDVEPYGFQQGDEVEITAGNLAGVRGLLVRRENKHQFIVELGHIGCSLCLKVDPHLLKAVGRREEQKRPISMVKVKEFAKWDMRLQV